MNNYSTKKPGQLFYDASHERRQKRTMTSAGCGIRTQDISHKTYRTRARARRTKHRASIFLSLLYSPVYGFAHAYIMHRTSSNATTSPPSPCVGSSLVLSRLRFILRRCITFRGGIRGRRLVLGLLGESGYLPFVLVAGISRMEFGCVCGIVRWFSQVGSTNCAAAALERRGVMSYRAFSYAMTNGRQEQPHAASS